MFQPGDSHGHLPFHSQNRPDSWVDYPLGIRRADFIKQLEQRSTELVNHVQALPEAAGRPYQSVAGRFRKDLSIPNVIHRDRVKEGLVAVLCVKETRRTIKQAYAVKRPRLVFTKRPQRALYHDPMDPESGLMSVRLETGFPCMIQVDVNGPRWPDKCGNGDWVLCSRTTPLSGSPIPRPPSDWRTGLPS